MLFCVSFNHWNSELVRICVSSEMINVFVSPAMINVFCFPDITQYFLFLWQPTKIEVDMVVDAALFLWNKTKSVFQKHQSGSSENPKYLQKMENPSKVGGSAQSVLAACHGN